jgi:hypothetical protein
MDPYLESPELWKEVQTGLIVAIADALDPQIRPRYRVSVERRSYLAVPALGDCELTKADEPAASSEQPPEIAPVTTSFGLMPRTVKLPTPAEMIERYLEIRDVVEGDIITTIEILSPANKSSREGRRRYEQKRRKVLSDTTHLVEIDLLRAGEPFPFQTAGDDDVQSDYRIIVSRAQDRPCADVYLFGVRDPIPDIPVPLQPGETESILHLNDILHQLYNRAGYDLAVNYEQPPGQPLSEEDARWVNAVVATIYPKKKMQTP